MKRDFFPSTVFLELTRHCNLRCEHCRIWCMPDIKNRLTVVEQEDIVRQCSKWAPTPELVFTGGEVILEMERLVHLSNLASQLGMVTVANTNGTLLDPAACEKICDSGLGKLAFSIDSAAPAQQDKTRGMPSTFAKCVENFQCLHRYKREKGRGPFLMTSSILYNHSLEYMENLIPFLSQLGSQSILFQALQPPFGEIMPEYKWPEQEPLWPGYNLVQKGLEAIRNKRDSGFPIDITDTQLELLHSYFENPLRLPRPCEAWKHILAITLDGSVRLCFNQHALGEPEIGNIRQASLMELWNSMKAQKIRARMRVCKRGCGVMLCHR